MQDIELIVDKKFDDNKETFSTKKDIYDLKEDLLNLKMDLERKMNDHLKWTMATIIAIGGLIVAMIKLL